MQVAEKLYVGYQGWFNAQGDGSELGFRHYGAWSKGKNNKVTVDMWPDLSEFSEDERFKTPFLLSNGKKAELFSSAHPNTVLRHFKWMSEYHIDGAFLQRFGTDIKGSSKLKKGLNKVLQNVRNASRQTGVEWALMYDLSGLSEGQIESVIVPDLKRLLQAKVTQDPYYIQHNGKPLIGIWGVGFEGRSYHLQEIQELLSLLKSDQELGGFSIMLGVPHKWRTLSEDAVEDEFLHQLLAQADIVSPWSVGRYRDNKGIQANYQRLHDDRTWLDKAGVDYLPVIFPGFSWHNLEKSRGRQSKTDLIPRVGGQFYWQQAVQARRAGAEMIYVAMFDELDEATAIFKVSNQPPTVAPFVTYEGLPSDHYLWLSSQIKKMLVDKTYSPNFPMRNQG